jgi:uncharacterized HhH-GPD family protein
VRQDRGVPTLRIAQDPAADELLSRDPLALLIGMLLDQQFPMERAFAGPRLIADRLGVDSLDAAALATADPEELAKVFQGPPAVHRYPGSMAARTQELCRLLVERYDGRAEGLWGDVADGATLLRRVGELPGFGAQKSRIFVALLGKQYGVTPPGWREAAGDYGQVGSRRSVADITGPESVAEVRAFKQEQSRRPRRHARRPETSSRTCWEAPASASARWHDGPWSLTPTVTETLVAPGRQREG